MLHVWYILLSFSLSTSTILSPVAVRPKTNTSSNINHDETGTGNMTHDEHKDERDDTAEHADELAAELTAELNLNWTAELNPINKYTQDINGLDLSTYIHHIISLSQSYLLEWCSEGSVVSCYCWVTTLTVHRQVPPQLLYKPFPSERDNRYRFFITLNLVANNSW